MVAFGAVELDGPVTWVPLQLPETYLPRSQGFGIALAQPSRPNPHFPRQGGQQLPFAYPSTLIQTPQQRSAAGLPPLAVPAAAQVAFLHAQKNGTSGR